MHPCLNVDEILRLVAYELVSSRGHRTAVALACCCKNFEDPVLDALWKTQDKLLPLLKSLPGDVWDGGGYNSLKRLPMTQEWDRLRKYARRMHSLEEISTPLSKVLSVLQFRVFDGPLFPNLRSLGLWFIAESFVPSIPLFLSSTITIITLAFNEYRVDKVDVASMIITFPKLCPNLQEVRLFSLPRDPVITAAISELLLNVNRDTLRSFQVDSSLTEEAREVISKLPDLCELLVIIEGNTSLPPVVLPNLTDLSIIHNGDNDWLRMFQGATLGELESIKLLSGSNQIGDFLGAFERVALTTSIPTTLLTFELEFDTTSEHPWRPNYRSLLPFTQLGDLNIESFCIGGCSSTIDDDTITDLARAMPMLAYLRLGGPPCGTPAGVTAKGLAALAYYCLDLDTLRIHFQAASLDPREIPAAIFGGGPSIPRKDCALEALEVGEIPVPKESVLMVALTLVRIFPHIVATEGYSEEWKEVNKALGSSRQLADRLRPTPESTILS